MLSSIVLVELTLTLTQKMNEINVLAGVMGREEVAEKVVMKSMTYG